MCILTNYSGSYRIYRITERVQFITFWSQSHVANSRPESLDNEKVKEKKKIG